VFRNVTQGSSYTDLLPSMNFSIEASDNLFVRVAAARTLARARMDQLRASQELNINRSRLCPTGTAAATCQGPIFNDPSNPVFTSSGGNPNLRPYLASGLDISVEKYFAGSGYVVLAGFYKKLDNWVFGSFPQTGVNFSAYTGLLTPAEQALLPSTTGISFGPRNLDGGYVKGIEFSTSIPFGVFNEALDGFGLLFSAAATESEIEPLPGITISVPGLSESTRNTTLFYEKAGFQARISQRYRDNFLGEVNGFGGGRDLRSVKEETIVDGQIGYAFQSGPLEGLSVLVQGLNLTDEPFVTYAGLSDRETIDYQEYGRTFLIGLNYKLN
jgi:iron complex outermembrane receptor protein